MNAPTQREWIKVVRDCDVVQIPDGHRVRLIRGTPVQIMQTLGGSFTVMTDWGNMVRIDPQDADAIGKQIVGGTTTAEPPPTTKEAVEERVWKALRNVYDPEIPVNVVELGLIYINEVTEDPPGQFKSYVRMTLTAPGCGMGNVLKDDAERRIRDIPNVKEALVDIVVDPPWDSSKMSEAARLELGL